ncbi:MAG: hypothetical protein ACP5HS_02180 [Anaerolineae bacterium]
MRRVRWFGALVVLFLTVMAGSGCTLTGRAQDDHGTTSPPIKGVAPIDSVEVVLLESFPVQAEAVAKGNLPDGCTELAEASVAREGNRFTVVLPTTRPADAVCTEALAPYEVTIPLDVKGLTAGSYTVDVNGVTASFDLAVDNELPSEGPVGDMSPCEGLPNEGETVLTDPAAGYCLRYPAYFVQDGECPTEGLLSGEVTSLRLDDDQYYEGTNLLDACVLVRVDPDVVGEGTCTEPEGPQETYMGQEEINGARFSVVSRAGVAAGHLYELTSYRTFHAEACYDVTLLVHSANIGVYPSGTVSEFDRDAVRERLEHVLHEFQFLDR